jgi:phage regulator Rha-like protein
MRSIRARDVKDQKLLESMRCLYMPRADEFMSTACFHGPRFGFQAKQATYRQQTDLAQQLRKSIPQIVYREYFSGTMKELVGAEAFDEGGGFEVLEERLVVLDEIRAALKEADCDVRVPSIFAVPRLVDDWDAMKEQADIITRMAEERALKGTAYTTAQMQKEFKAKHMTTLGEVLKSRVHMHKQYLKRVEKTTVEAYIVKNKDETMDTLKPGKIFRGGEGRD